MGERQHVVCAARTLFLVLLFGENWEVDHKPVVIHGWPKYCGGCQVRYETVEAGSAARIPSGCAWQIGLAPCINPLYHSASAPS